MGNSKGRKILIFFVFILGGILSGFSSENLIRQPVQDNSAVAPNAQGSKSDSTQSSVPVKASDTTAIPTNPESAQSERGIQIHKGFGGFVQKQTQTGLLPLKTRLIRYGEQHFPATFRGFYLSIIQLIYKYPISIFFILLIFIFVLNILLVLLILYLSNQYKNRKDRYIGLYRGMYETALQSYLFGEIEWDKVKVKLKKIDHPLNRRIMADLLLNYQENLRGEMDAKIADTFIRLGLHNDAIKLAGSVFYHKKIRGLRELTNLYPEGAKPIVDKAINDANDLVRGEAQTSYIRLHPDAPFDFFRSLTRPFTRWTQLSAFYLFRLHQLPVPQFANYLDSSHTNVRNFSLRMIIFFQQLENAQAVFAMLSSQYEMTRNLSIQAINDLRLFEGKEMIKERYGLEPQKNRLEIIKALKNIGNSDDYNFLEAILKSGTISEKIEACRTMYFMTPESCERLLQFNRDNHNALDLYIAHVTESRN